MRYYGYRFYSPSLGRWLSRDPLGDPAFVMSSRSSALVENHLLDLIDVDEFLSSLEDVRPELAKFLKARLLQSREYEKRLTSLYGFVSNDPIGRFDPVGLLDLGSYGKYCGPGWCGGKKQSEKDCACSKDPLPDPDNAIDACCKTHDTCLGGGGSHECDDAMCECLKGVDPVNEPVPPGGSLDNQIKSYNKMLGLFCGMKIPGH
jgi:hypothetical protein